MFWWIRPSPQMMLFPKTILTGWLLLWTPSIETSLPL